MNTTPQKSIIVECGYYEKYDDIKGDIEEGERENLVYTKVSQMSEVATIKESQINLYVELLKKQSAFVAPYRDEIGVYIKNIKTNIDKLNIEYTNTEYTNPDNDNIFLYNIKIFSGYNRDSLRSKIGGQRYTLNIFLRNLNAFLYLENPYKEKTYTIEERDAFVKPPPVVAGVFPFKGGTYNKTNKKSILGKERCIYKKSGDRKEYIKYKGNLIAVREYKKLMKILKKK